MLGHVHHRAEVLPDDAVLHHRRRDGPDEQHLAVAADDTERVLVGLNLREQK